MPSTSSASSSKMVVGGGGSRRTSSKSRSKGGDRQLTRIEEKVWKTIKGAPNSKMTGEQAQAALGNISVVELQATIDRLLKKSLLSGEHSPDNVFHLVATTRAEASTMGKLEADEELIFQHISESKNEGIWTRQLKMKVNVHQTVLARGLKSLEGKNLIKVVKNVKFPTRKIYMLAGLTPSAELSGGPWYTDHELDTAFIEQLSRALHAYIVKKTWPQESLPQNSKTEADRPLFLASYTSKLPSTHTCWQWLTEKNLTNTKLTKKDVQDLLDVLVYDGKIEKIPFVRLDDMDDDADYKPSKSNKRRVKRSDSESDEGSQSDAEGSDRSTDSSDHSGRSRKRKRSSSSKSSKRSRSHSSRKGKSQRSLHKNNSKSKSIRLSDDDSESEDDSDVDDDDDFDDQTDLSSSSSFSEHVYRALRQLRGDTGWVEVPCAHCPVFDFCHPGGPVNGEACLYLRDWIKDSLASYAKKAEEVEYVQTNGVHDDSIAYDDEEDGDALELIGGSDE